MFKTLTANSGGIKNGIDRRNSSQAADWWIVEGRGPTPHYRSVQENQSGHGPLPLPPGFVRAGLSIWPAVAISPDGQWVAYTAQNELNLLLRRHSLDD